ncbi:MAG: hypothetical protein IPG20_22305 [Gammaproteobacteria bacterium]|nr:hypothetical protein [Gammaproteobacteria bacterium]
MGEAGGIAHLVPGYDFAIKLKAEGIIRGGYLLEAQTNDPLLAEFHRTENLMNALADFSDRWAH